MTFGQTDPEETIVQLEPGLDISEDRCQVNDLLAKYLYVGLFHLATYFILYLLCHH